MSTTGHDTPEASTPTRLIEHRRLYSYDRKSQGATTGTLAALLATALQTDVVSVTIINRGETELHVNPTAAATTSNGGLVQNESIVIDGAKAELDLVQLISATGSIDVDIAQYVNEKQA